MDRKMRPVPLAFRLSAFSLSFASTSHDSHPIFLLTNGRRRRRVKKPNCVAYDVTLQRCQLLPYLKAKRPLICAHVTPLSNLGLHSLEMGSECTLIICFSSSYPAQACHVSCSPLADGKESRNSSRSIAIGNSVDVFGHGRQADQRCRKMFQKSVTKWDGMGWDGSVA